MNIRIKKYRKQFIFFIDLIIIASSYVIFLPFTYKTVRNVNDMITFLPHMFTLLFCIILCQFLLKTYHIIWRYAEANEYIKLVLGITLGFFIYEVINHCIFKSKTPFLLCVSTYSVSNLMMLLMRFSYRRYIKYQNRSFNKKIKLAIIGAGSAGVRLMEEIQNNKKGSYQVCCFFDDNKEKIGKKIRGIKVLGPIENFNHYLNDMAMSEVIIAIPTLTEERKNEILNIVSSSNLKVKVLPSILSILQEEENNLLSSVKEFDVEELLGRESVSFNQEELELLINQKVILITGGGGSIGSELCRQIARLNPLKLVILDNYENNAYEIQQELLYKYKDKLDLAVEIASVQDERKLDQIFERYRPQIVFHAAAHKHVPFMEDCPDEAIKNNIFGTYHTVIVANKWKVQKFVLISTDKAVNPTSMMGASKRMCEMIVQSMKNISTTEYVTVRFGNVLGSNGSVIPLFMHQIEQGGPVTITDKRATRYFMTIPEAAQLVLRAGAMALESEVFVLDMGKPVNILALAEKLIRLMGHTPYTEISIKEIGIRKGEKLEEELIMQEEELIKTKNQKIYIERQKEITPEEIDEKLNRLLKSLESKNINDIKQVLKDVILTFKQTDYRE